jgi:hypothetical protein
LKKNEQYIEVLNEYEEYLDVCLGINEVMILLIKKVVNKFDISIKKIINLL